MKEKTKEFLKKYLIGFILGVVSAGVIIVYAETYFPSNDVTYDNTESGLSSTDVQGAIDELYGVCFPKSAGDAILDNTDIVTSGDGLYEDEYEDGRYFYKGGNPNNYVTFNNEDAGWRIISIEPDGTIKIMKINSIGTQSWDTSVSNNWSRPAELNIYLNGTYYNSLVNEAKNQIVSKDFSIGTVMPGDTDMINTVNSENSKKWNGKIALPTVSEYIRSNSNKSSCGTVSQLENAKSGQCKGTTWMYNSNNWYWTLSTFSYSDYKVYLVFNGNGVIGENSARATYGVQPVVYLSSEVKITGGNGSQSSPYEIE